jgi:hypothetical protein
VIINEEGEEHLELGHGQVDAVPIAGHLIVGCLEHVLGQGEDTILLLAVIRGHGACLQE